MVRGRGLGFVLAFIGGAGVMAAVAALAGWWNGTSTPVILNTVNVERSIEASILSQRHLESRVSTERICSLARQVSSDERRPRGVRRG